MSEIMTHEDVKNYLRISKNTAYEIMRREDFPKFMVGRQMRVKKDDFQAWLEKQKMTG
jgi:excisionase family DNA binding protein